MKGRNWWPLSAASLCLGLSLGFGAIEYLAIKTGGPRPTTAFIFNPFTAVAAASVFVRYLIHDSRGRSREAIIHLIPAAFVLGAGSAIFGVALPISIMVALVGLGLLGVGGFISGALLARDRLERFRFLDRLAVALILPIAASMTPFGLWSTYRVNPVYDAQVYAFEEILGFQFSIIGVRTYHFLSPLSQLATGCYAALALGLVVTAAKQRSLRLEVDVLVACVAAGLVGFLLYFACPVVGPLTAFASSYPVSLPTIQLDRVPALVARIGAPRNGMPSLHAAWALLIWFNARTLAGAWRLGLRVFAGLTLWAVMGLDDTHWLMDVIVTVPFVVTVQLMFVGSSSRSSTRVDAALCAVLTAAWLIAFRHADLLLRLPRLAAWTVVGATVVIPLSRLRLADAMPADARDAHVEVQECS